MQSNIRSFFKPSSSSSPKPKDPPTILDELDFWEKSEHNIINTFERRAPKSNGSETNKVAVIDYTKKSDSNKLFSKPDPTISGIVLNNKRSYAQFHLELGQSDFLLHTCSTCGVKYAPGDEGDEKAHRTFHKDYTHGIQFKGWLKERIVYTHTIELERIVVVLDSDPPAQKNKVQEVVKMMEFELGGGWIYHKLCKVYMFISSQRIAGCVVAEPIKHAFKVLSQAENGKTDGAARKEKRPKSTTLRFGEVVLQREVMKRCPSVNYPELLDKNHNRAIICEDEVVHAVCGIRAIWVAPSKRRRSIAKQLLDAVRRSFCTVSVLERSQLAFSQPTSAGKALASTYTGTGSFLVYKSDIVD
ncbi:zf-C2H2_3 domain-containing protein/Acetyltransf_13 domain-containing protein [Cephalotus follicularis]|uniref:Zf-C2H2_3 domain-containing protein/Acetyltransf_13 domain-containing protein n=1 Tax=Cephalotus follicularis TaxID=3775 RepID=A0A1Q3ANH7_CEPFO|nr:zf-C2H2_3 domain-containing protein/Acetyltransf_13 domain-containing protein [Cephalotus follicularis]